MATKLNQRTVGPWWTNALTQWTLLFLVKRRIVLHLHATKYSNLISMVTKDSKKLYILVVYECCVCVGVLTSLPRICSSVSCTSIRGLTVVKSFHHGQPLTPRFFLMFFWMQRMAKSWICHTNTQQLLAKNYESKGKYKKNQVTVNHSRPSW